MKKIEKYDQNKMRKVTRKINDLIKSELNLDLEKCGFLILFSLPPGFNDVHWISNYKKQNLVKIIDNSRNYIIEQMGKDN